MALIKCPECDRENVSDSAESCPNCGYGIKVHFEKIKIEEERIQRDRKAEEERKRAEIEAKRLKEEQIKSVPKPSKPRISIAGLVISGLIMWLAFSQINTSEYKRQWSIYNGEGDPVFAGALFLIIGIAILFYVIWIFSKQRGRYNLAQSDFEEYQRTVIKERDEAIAKQRVQAEAERYKQMTAPKCPMCGSINIEKISTTSRVISVAAVGLASRKIGKQYKCKKCKHMW